jgi:hypothetical protein
LPEITDLVEHRAEGARRAGGAENARRQAEPRAGGDGEESMAPRHRNNAAEWLLWLLLIPAVPVAWIVAKIRRRNGE